MTVMETSFEFLKNFDPQKDKLEVNYLQSLGWYDVNTGDLNPITNRPLENGCFGLAKNRQMEISINNTRYYLWSFFADDFGDQVYEGDHIIISKNKDFTESECFDFIKLGIYTSPFRFKKPLETPSLILRFLKFFLDVMDHDYAQDFEKDLWGENGIEFLRTNPPIDTENDFTKHQFNWMVKFDRTLFEQIDKYGG